MDWESIRKKAEEVLHTKTNEEYLIRIFLEGFEKLFKKTNNPELILGLIHALDEKCSRVYSINDPNNKRVGSFNQTDRSIFINKAYEIEKQIYVTMHELRHLMQGFYVSPFYMLDEFIRVLLCEADAISTVERHLITGKISKERGGHEIFPFGNNGIDFTLLSMLEYLLGNEFIDKWRENTDINVDFIGAVQKSLEDQFGEEYARQFMEKFNICIMMSIGAYKNVGICKGIMKSYLDMIKVVEDSSISDEFIETEIEKLKAEIQRNSSDRVMLERNTHMIRTFEKFLVMRKFLKDKPTEYQRRKNENMQLINGILKLFENDTPDNLFADSVIEIKEIFKIMVGIKIKSSSNPQEEVARFNELLEDLELAFPPLRAELIEYVAKLLKQSNKQSNKPPVPKVPGD